MQRFKWHSSNSYMFTNYLLGFNDPFSDEPPFYKKVDNCFSPKKYAYVESYLWVLIDQNGFETRIFCSIDGRLLQLKNIMAYDIRDVKVIDVDKGVVLTDYEYDRLKRYIIISIFGKNAYDMQEEIMNGKTITLVHVFFNENLISDKEINMKINKLFDKNITEKF